MPTYPSTGAALAVPRGLRRTIPTFFFRANRTPPAPLKLRPLAAALAALVLAPAAHGQIPAATASPRVPSVDVPAAQAPSAEAPAPRGVAAVVADGDGDRVPDRVGQPVAVEAVVTRARFRLAPGVWGITVQDPTAGVMLAGRDSAGLALRPGERVRVWGRLRHHRGMTLVLVDSLQRLGRGPEPEPRPVVAADLHGERFAGRLVEVSGTLVVLAEGGRIPRLVLEDRSGRIPVVMGPDVLDDPQFVKRLLDGGPAEVAGIAGQYTAAAGPPYHTGYRLYPRGPEDVRLHPAPPYAAFARWGVLLGLMAALGYVALRRRAAERRTREMAALTDGLRRSEDALRQSEARLRLFISQAPAILWSTDRDLRFTFGRGGGLSALGDAGDRMTGRSLAEYFGTDDPDYPALAGHRRALAGEPAEYETDWVGRTFQARVEPLHGPDGGIVGTIGVAFDITERTRAAAVLRDSERHFRALIENAYDVVAVLGEDGTVRYLSPGVTRALGYTPEELEGQPEFRLVHPDDLPRTYAQFEQLLREPGGRVTIEPRCLHKDGSWRRLEAVGTNLLHDPAVRGLVVNLRDVTARRETEEALVLQTAYQEQLFEGAPEGIVLLDLDDRVLRANREFLRMFGYTADEVRGRGINALIVPDDRREEGEAFSREAAGGGRIGVDSVRRRSDGSPVHVSILATQVRIDGNPVGLFTIYRDIGMRKAAEEALRRREAQLAEAQQLAHLGSWHADLVTGETAWSDESYRILGLSPGSVASYEGFLQCVHPDDRPAVMQKMAAGTAFHAEFRIVRPDGSVRIVESRIELFTDGEGVPVRLLGSTQDVTDWRHLEAQLRQAQKMEAVGRLAGGIAHDFNNLLTAISGHAELVKLDLPAGSPFRDDIEEITRAATRAAGLTRQLLAYSRNQVMQTRVLDLNTVVAESGSMLRRLIGEDVEFRTALSPDPGFVRADPVQIEQVLMNLVVNARDAMPGGGSLVIHTRPETVGEGDHGPTASLKPGPYAVLSVRDTGVGMAPETLSRIFEPFFTTKEVGKGTGLGLSTAFGIVRQSGGDIVVNSRPGEGSVFEVFLPRVKPSEAAGCGAAPAAAPPARQGTRATVLVVEDEAAVRHVVRRTLERDGHRVLVARTGREALRLAEAHRGEVDLVVSDVVMPEMSGPELAERIRRLQPHARILFVSGYTDLALKRRGAVEAEPEFLQKPFDPGVLAQRIRRILDRPARAA